jgi:hypothetical protein
MQGNHDTSVEQLTLPARTLCVLFFATSRLFLVSAHCFQGVSDLDWVIGLFEITSSVLAGVVNIGGV